MPNRFRALRSAVNEALLKAVAVVAQSPEYDTATLKEAVLLFEA